MFGNAQITLTQIANGWLVILPYVEPDYDNEYEIRKQMRIALDESQKDPLLSELMDEPPTHKKKSIFDLKQSRTHFFTTFLNALEFLNTIK